MIYSEKDFLCFFYILSKCLFTCKALSIAIEINLPCSVCYGCSEKQENLLICPTQPKAAPLVAEEHEAFPETLCSCQILPCLCATSVLRVFSTTELPASALNIFLHNNPAPRRYRWDFFGVVLLVWFHQEHWCDLGSWTKIWFYRIKCCSVSFSQYFFHIVIYKNNQIKHQITQINKSIQSCERKVCGKLFLKRFEKVIFTWSWIPCSTRLNIFLLHC